jgi:hypothetical protein
MSKIFPHLADSARLQRRERNLARIRTVGLVTVAVAKSAGNLAGACAVVAGGGFAAWHFLGDVRQPDAVLLHRAIDQARAAAVDAAYAAAHPSAVVARDQALGLVVAAVLFGMTGVAWLVEWWKALSSIRRVMWNWPRDWDAE